MIRAFCAWLAATPLSVAIGSARWVVPLVQTIHILAIAAVLSSILMMELRVLEMAGRTQTLAQISRRFVPWVYGGLIVLLVTGTLLIVSEPARSLINPAFWTKMGLLAVALVATFRLQGAQWKIAESVEPPARSRALTRALAVLIVLVWCGIAVAGRWIAYVEH